MVMEFQGKKATHDFLSLYTKDSSMQLQDPIPPSNNYNLKTQDFLKPLEKAEETAVAHVLPGGIGTYSICHVAECDMSADVKPEIISCVSGSGVGSKMEPVSGVFGSGAFGLWDTPAASTANSKEFGFRGQWPSSFAARSSASFSSRAFSEECKEDELFGKIECASRKELISTRVDRKSGKDQKPTTPRSKHSATEQRRRSKINDRFQMLRDLIPHSDQKRDKASFLLEVIEYIRFLQEKVQKHEPSCHGWIEESNKSTPWNKSHVLNIATVDQSEIKINPIEEDINNNHQTSMERGTWVTQQRSVSDADNLYGQWLKPNDYSGASSNMLINEHEDLVIDEGTISVSTAYSQNLLNTLNQALESSGIDMSQASLAVNINLGKRASKRAKNFEDCEKALKKRRHSPDK